MRHRLATATLLGIAMVVGACAGAASPAPATPAPATPAPATEAPTEAPATAPATAAPSEAPPAASASVGVAETSLGTILVDGAGLSLYVFTPDKGGASTCYDACATAWPPLLSGGAPTVGAGLDGSAFGSTTRTDGGAQVTFNGWPLYYFAGDAAAGDANGQGLNDVWWVVGPDGTMIGAPAS
jgi:predicted lipoprotein with Yx(FWY)xxD motif